MALYPYIGRKTRQHPDAAVAELAARQHGNVTRAQLRALGLTDEAIDHRVRTGRLHRVYRGVYAVGRPPGTPLERASAAVLACGVHAILSHRSALALWGFTRSWAPPFDVTVTAGNPRPRHITVHRSRTLTRTDVTVQLGIRVTSPARTLIDCAPAIDPSRLARLVNDALLSPYLTREQLAEACARSPAQTGGRLLTPFTTTTDGPTRSEFEDRFLAFCEHYGFPRPRVNTHVAGHEADALFPKERLIVELDGWRFHGDRRTYESDRDRDADRLAAGYVTVRITWERLSGSPAREAKRLRVILRRLGWDG
ncbi:MAG: type IV toxin-antitoxin system AbiEi family antitoxin domain-containing protein [Solirubrobacteraceae bacterium]